jgi:hypothetical protein
MEFEGVVANQLKALGYPIFYRNFRIFLNRNALSEFDIVSHGFIVEVKSGRDYGTKGLNFMYTHKVLPIEFKYYIYCPMLDDSEISCLNENMPRKNVLYINSYGPIIRNHKPMRDCVITNDSILANFLNLEMSVINTFGTLYMKREIFDKMYYRVYHWRDRLSYTDNMKWSDKIEYLVRLGRISFDEPPANVPLMVKGYFNINTIRLKRLEQFTIDQVYYINTIPKDKKMVDIHLSLGIVGVDRDV